MEVIQMYASVPVVSDSLSLYLSEIRKFPVLSESEERRLALRLYDDQDLEAAQTLIKSNLRFVVKIAGEYRNYGLKMLDLIQEGNIGLMMAVKKFDPHKGFRLISYAVWWIRAYIQNYIVSAWSLVKIGTTQAQRKLFFKLKQAKNAIRQMTGLDLDLPATAQALDLSESDVVEMDMRMQGDVSLDAELANGDGMTALDGLADERPNQELLLGEFEERQQLKSAVAIAIEQLNEKERYVIEHRIVADDPKTLQEIAGHFAISRERVRQIEEGALKKVKKSLMPLLSAA
jgi:RNA polymerase sigma-32 factor